VNFKGVELGARKAQIILFLKRITLKKVRREKLGTESSSSFTWVRHQIFEVGCA